MPADDDPTADAERTADADDESGPPDDEVGEPARANDGMAPLVTNTGDDDDDGAASG